MAGAFGDNLNSRADFRRESERARKLVAAVLVRLPEDETLISVERQLVFVEKATKGGRTPTAKERHSLDMGLRLHREYEVVTDDDELNELKDLVSGLGLFFEYWPDDALAADPDNDDKIDWDDPSED